jgi:hypothetical protein
MVRTSKRKSKLSTVKKLRTVLTEIAVSAPSSSFAEGEKFVCSVCQLPVKLCNTDPMKRCEHMVLEGTELQLLRHAGKQQVVSCIRCGDVIPERTLKKDPLAELCPNCLKSLSTSKPQRRSKGASL